MEIGPIFSAMMRSRTGAVLIALQIAFTLAIVVNATHMIRERIKFIDRPSGIDSDNIVVASTLELAGNDDARASIRRDLESLRHIPGVREVGYADAIPLSGSGSASSIKAGPEENAPAAPVNYYHTDHKAIDALGVDLIAGEGFSIEEITWDEPNVDSPFPDKVIITQAVADKLFPGENAVGRLVYNNLGEAAEVGGVIRLMHGAWVHWPNFEQVVLYPVVRAGGSPKFFVRVEEGRVAELVPEIERVLQQDRSRMVVRVKPLAEYIAESYRNDRSIARVLTVVIVQLFAVTALGIVGLASFNVRQRTRQIGTRRAVGAQQLHILRYFLVENWLMTSFGAVLGSILAVALNYWLVTAFEMPKLEIGYIVLGVWLIWILGVLAVLGPARRASKISPVVATRNV